MRAALLVLLLLGGCGDGAAPRSKAPAGAGAALEAAAIRRGVITDPARTEPVGVYVSETDTLCIVPASGGYAIGAAVDYGEGQGCVARGSASGTKTLAVSFGEDCRFAAAIAEDRVTFPAILPAGCDRSCRGRASLSALSASRTSASGSEARSVTAMDRRPLCS